MRQISNRVLRRSTYAIIKIKVSLKREFLLHNFNNIYLKSVLQNFFHMHEHVIENYLSNLESFL